jgi:hypothetical protein
LRKSYTDYQVCIGDTFIGTSFSEDKLYAFMPGSIQDETCPPQEKMYERGVRIVAAVFADGGSEGDPAFSVERMEERKGVDFVVTRTRAIISDSLDSPTEKDSNFFRPDSRANRGATRGRGAEFSPRAKIGVANE